MHLSGNYYNTYYKHLKNASNSFKQFLLIFWFCAHSFWRKIHNVSILVSIIEMINIQYFFLHQFVINVNKPFNAIMGIGTNVGLFNTFATHFNNMTPILQRKKILLEYKVL